MIDWFTIIVIRWRELDSYNIKNPPPLLIIYKKRPLYCRYFLNVVSPTFVCSLAVLSNTFYHLYHDFVIFVVFFARYNVLYRPDASFYS